MSGSTLAVTVLAATCIIGAAVGSAGAASLVAARAASTADAAALAGADTAAGFADGDPCARASEIAHVGGATVDECILDGLTATVSVSIPFGPFRATAVARAGQPP